MAQTLTLWIIIGSTLIWIAVSILLYKLLKQRKQELHLLADIKSAIKAVKEEIKFLRIP